MGDDGVPSVALHVHNKNGSKLKFIWSIVVRKQSRVLTCVSVSELLIDTFNKSWNSVFPLQQFFWIWCVCLVHVCVCWMRLFSTCPTRPADSWRLRSAQPRRWGIRWRADGRSCCGRRGSSCAATRRCSGCGAPLSSSPPESSGCPTPHRSSVQKTEKITRVNIIIHDQKTTFPISPVITAYPPFSDENEHVGNVIQQISDPYIMM